MFSGIINIFNYLMINGFMQNTIRSNKIIQNFNEAKINIQEREYFYSLTRAIPKELIISIFKNLNFPLALPDNGLKQTWTFSLVPYLPPPLDLDPELDNYFTEYTSDVAAYDRKDTVEESHYSHTKTVILKQAQGMRGHALILGYGDGFDIPLETLVAQFDRLTLVDMNLRAMQGAISVLSEDLKKKIRLIQCDLTNILLALTYDLKGIKLNTSLAIIEGEAKKILAKYINSNSDIEFEDKFDFVVSSMLTTQLCSVPLDFVCGFLKIRLGLVENLRWASDLRGETNLQELIHQLNIAHIDLLHRSCTDTGKALWIDHAEIQLTSLVKGYYCKGPLTPALPLAAILQTARAHFRLIGTDTKPWIWETKLPKENEDGTSCIVSAYVFQNPL
jgi:hypothetical protein